MHSFLVWGRYAGELSGLDNRSSFGQDSPFAFMKEHNARMLLVDTTITAAFTFVHHVEEMERVKYRKYRKYQITVDNPEGTPVVKEYLLYAKRPGWTMKLDGLENLLRGKKAAIEIIDNRVAYTVVDLAASYPLIVDDIRHNRARLLARFSLFLYLREKAKTLAGIFRIHTLADKISHDPGI